MREKKEAVRGKRGTREERDISERGEEDKIT